MPMKSGTVEMVDVKTPSAVKPGGSFEVEIQATNSAQIVFNDPDTCSRAGNPCSAPIGSGNGYCIMYSATVYNRDGTQHATRSTKDCLEVPVVPGGTNRDTVRLTLPAPDVPDGASEQVEVTAHLRATGSGQTTTPMSTTILVTSDVTRLPPSDDDGDGDDNGGDEPDLNDRLDQLGTLAVLGLGVWGLSSVADVVDDD